MRKSKEQEAPRQYTGGRETSLHMKGHEHELGPGIRPIRTAVALVVREWRQGGEVVCRVRGELSCGQ